ncbi:MAG: BspA family leucine-rich repeat surface protein [Clostridia bacterium]|nr:BspA family leucine-rich repeat surface protein [Clostridia bacterium]
MKSMFYGCNHLTELDLSKWNTANLNNANAMFGFSSINTIDFRHLDLSNCSDCANMLRQSSSLTKVYVEQTPTYKAGSNHSNMFTGTGTSGFTVKQYDE